VAVAADRVELVVAAPEALVADLVVPAEQGVVNVVAHLRVAVVAGGLVAEGDS
jgi:hypothetical protein